MKRGFETWEGWTADQWTKIKGSMLKYMQYEARRKPVLFVSVYPFPPS